MSYKKNDLITRCIHDIPFSMCKKIGECELCAHMKTHFGPMQSPQRDAATNRPKHGNSRSLDRKIDKRQI